MLASAISTVMEVSMTHVREQSQDWLKRYAIYDGDFGYVVSTLLIDSEPTCPEEIKHIVAKAWETLEDIPYITFDMDGEIHDDLPVLS